MSKNEVFLTSADDEVSKEAGENVETCKMNDFDQNVINFVSDLKRRQDFLHQMSEAKSHAKRRLVFGVHETSKHFTLGNIIAVVYAKNIDDRDKRARQNYDLLRRECIKKNIPFIQAATKREISRCVSKYPYISLVGIKDIQGFEDRFAEIVETWKRSALFIGYHMDQPSLFA